MVIAAIVMGTGVILILGAALRAPLGYQDESGFHLGVKQNADRRADCEFNPS